MLNPWFITGFCDGVAAFTYSKAGGSFNLYFSVRQTKEKSGFVEEIRRFFDGVGAIYGSKTSVYYRVAKIDELKIIVHHFDRYPLQSKKQEAYQIWRQMVLHKIENYRSVNYDMLKMLSERLAKATRT